MYLQSYSFFFLRAIIIYKEKKGSLLRGKWTVLCEKVVQMASKSARDYTAKWHQKVISRCASWSLSADDGCCVYG